MTTIKLFLLAFSLTFFAFSLSAQTNVNYTDIDPLISKNSMSDALTALSNLKVNHKNDTADPGYWIRFSQASYTCFRYQDAVNGINKAVRLGPANAECYFEKGMLYNKMGVIDTAKNAFDKAIKIAPAGKYYYWRGIIHQQLKNNINAESDYRNAIAMNFESAELYTNLGILFSDQEKYPEAVAYATKALTLNKNYAPAYVTREKAYVCMMNIDSACADMKSATALRYRNVFFIPDSICNGSEAKKLEFAAEVLISSLKYKQSIVAYSGLIDKKIYRSDYFLNRGYAYYQLKEYANAEKDYLMALTLPNPAKDLIYDNLSLLYFDQDLFLQSIEYSTKRIELNPRNPVPYIDRGLCYRKLKRYTEAEADFNTSLEIKPDFHRAFAYRAFLYLELDQYVKAAVDAEKAIIIDPKYGYGYLVLAQAEQRIGKPDFCKSFHNAKKYGEPDADIAIMQYCK